MPVNSLHPEYDAHSKKTALVRAIIGNTAQKYIRYVDIDDPDRSKQYREDAILTNVTKLTRDGLVGLIFRKPPEITLPPELEYLNEDATGDGMNLTQVLPKCAREILTAAREGLLIDYPAEGVNLKARMKLYASETILNHKSKLIGDELSLSLVTLQEMIDVPDPLDPFIWNLEPQYRALMLDDDNNYCQQVYDKNLLPVGGLIYPVKLDGSLWDKIPFIFLGSENNDPEFDSIPLEDLAILNLGHYRNSADYEESIFFTGQVMPVVCVGESDPLTFREINPQGVKFGSRGCVVLASGGKLDLAQANPNTLVGEAMKEKIIQAAAIGARLISPAGGRETAEAARIRYGAQNSSLHVLTDNLGEGFEQAIQWMCEFMGGDPEVVEVSINSEFYEDSADPNLVMAMIQLRQLGDIAPSDILAYGRQTGWIADNRSDEDIAAEAALHPVVAPVTTTPKTTNNNP